MAEAQPPLTVTARSPDHPAAVAAIVSTAIVGDLGFFIMPLLIGGMVDAYRISETTVGYIIALQLGALAATAFVLAPRMHRIDRRFLGLVGLGLVVVGNVATAAGTDFALLVAARSVTGAGEGLVQAVGAAAGAETRNPERTFALVSLGVVFMSLGIFLGLPSIVIGLGPQGTFALIAAVVVLISPLLLFLPPYYVVRHHHRAETISAFTLIGFAALLALLLFNMSANAPWFYVGRMGHRIGLDIEDIGRILALASVIAIAGPVAAHRLGVRYGRTKPLLLALAASAAGSLWLAHTYSHAQFTAAVCLASIAVMFGGPYFMGLLSALDPAGRLTAAAKGFQAIGNTLAPGVAASILLVGADYEGIGWTAFVTALIAAVLVLPASLRLSR